jgi:hypothetical protein
MLEGGGGGGVKFFANLYSIKIKTRASFYWWLPMGNDKSTGFLDQISCTLNTKSCLFEKKGCFSVVCILKAQRIG